MGGPALIRTGGWPIPLFGPAGQALLSPLDPAGCGGVAGQALLGPLTLGPSEADEAATTGSDGEQRGRAARCARRAMARGEFRVTYRMI